MQRVFRRLTGVRPCRPTKFALLAFRPFPLQSFSVSVRTAPSTPLPASSSASSPVHPATFTLPTSSSPPTSTSNIDLDTGNSLLSLELQHQHDSEHQQRQEEDVDDTDELTSSLDRLRASVAECRAETSWTQFQHLQESNRTDELSTDTLLDMLYVVGKYGHEGSVRLHRIDLLSSTIRSRSITQREYNRLVGGLACIGSYQLGLDVVREMKSLGMFVFDETYAALVRHMVSHRQVDMALKLFRSLSSSSSSSSATTSPTDQERADVVASRTSVILSAFLQGFSRISDYDSVISFAQLKQKSGTLTKRDYLWILNVCLHYEMVEEADKWMDQMINEGFNLDLVSVRRALYCYAKGNAINRTKYWFRRFQEMDFERKDISGYNFMLWAYARTQDIESLTTLFHDMKHRGPQPNTITFNILMDGFIKSKQYATAMAVMREMKTQRIPLNKHSYAIVLNALTKGGNMEMTKTILDEMNEMDVAPTMVAYNTLMHGHLLAGDFHLSMTMYHQLTSQGVSPDIYTMTTLLNGAVKTNQLELAEVIYNDLRDKKLEFSPHTYSVLMALHGRRGDLESVEKTFAECRRIRSATSSKLYFYNMYLYACCKCKHVDGAKTALKALKEDGLKPNVATYAMLMELSSIEGRCDNILKLFNLLVRDETVVVDQQTVATVLRLLGRHGHVDAAKKTYDAVKQSQKRTTIEFGPLVWRSQIQLLLENEDIESAKEVFYEMLPAPSLDPAVVSVPSNIRLFTVDEHTLGSVFQLFRQAKKWEELNEMILYLDRVKPILLPTPNFQNDDVTFLSPEFQRLFRHSKTDTVQEQGIEE